MVLVLSLLILSCRVYHDHEGWVLRQKGLLLNNDLNYSGVDVDPCIEEEPLYLP